ncbi:uncharacterized protein LOC126987269 [Eriocheir sinensis]|uniref:uncharacterized protein LOC126987269 n=1 Tax=Eriocheir sinensis TaxID=95602 RepID=UPI0021C814BD|nr:uncharacterized protein LOC126987269 [Eriocheir sinensis]XP_050700093.1 uncharacterized protein LOC126987269 [Eriocheir sinensis]
METSKVKQLLEGRSAFARREDGLDIYYVQPQETRQDAETGARAVHIGRPNGRPTRCVMLLGETGAGKTTFINAVLNHLFGVEFADSFRLQVKEEIEDGRRKTESQTDTINVYTIHYKEGMRHEYNVVLIDTPGLADTRGAQRQEHVKSRLERFLMSEDIGVDELHCVGLVAKANVNRDFTDQKAVLGEIMSLLGASVPEITCLLATYGVDEPSVDAVVRNAGIAFKRMFRFDNGIIYTPQKTTNTSENNQAAIASIRWKEMRKQYDAFFSHLSRAPPVSNRVRREKKLFDTSKNNLKEGIKKLATSIAALHVYKKLYNKFELQESENKEWRKEEMEEIIIQEDLNDTGNGVYPHNCRKCLVTCHLCRGSVEDEVLGATVCGAGAIAAGAAGAVVVAEGTAAAGTAAVVATEEAAAAGAALAATETVAAAGAALAAMNPATLAAMNPATLAAVAGAVLAATETVGAAGAAVAATETVGAAGAAVAATETVGAAGAAVAATETVAAAGAAVAATETVGAAGAAVAATETVGAAGAALAAMNPATLAAVAAGGAFTAAVGLGLGAGYFIAKIVNESDSCDMDTNTECTEKGCHHPLSDHVRMKKIIIKQNVMREKINDNMKSLYDAALSKKSEIMNKINKTEENILSRRRIISQNTVEALHHAMRIQAFTSQHFDYIENINIEIIKAVLDGPAITPHALEHANVLDKAMKQLASFGSQEVLGKHELVEKMLLSVYRKDG